MHVEYDFLNLCAGDSACRKLWRHPTADFYWKDGTIFPGMPSVYSQKQHMDKSGTGCFDLRRMIWHFLKDSYQSRLYPTWIYSSLNTLCDGSDPCHFLFLSQNGFLLLIFPSKTQLNHSVSVKIPSTTQFSVNPRAQHHGCPHTLNLSNLDDCSFVCLTLGCSHVLWVQVCLNSSVSFFLQWQL